MLETKADRTSKRNKSTNVAEDFSTPLSIQMELSSDTMA